MDRIGDQDRGPVGRPVSVLGRRWPGVPRAWPARGRAALSPQDERRRVATPRRGPGDLSWTRLGRTEALQAQWLVLHLTARGRRRERWAKHPAFARDLRTVRAPRGNAR